MGRKGRDRMLCGDGVNRMGTWGGCRESNSRRRGGVVQGGWWGGGGSQDAGGRTERVAGGGAQTGRMVKLRWVEGRKGKVDRDRRRGREA